MSVRWAPSPGGRIDQWHGGRNGRAAALEFTAQGACVVGCDLNREAADKTVADVVASGGEMTPVAPVDLTTAEDNAQWVEHAVTSYCGIDILYDNASSASGRGRS